MNIVYTHMQSPIGRVRVVWSDEGLHAVQLGSEPGGRANSEWTHDPGLRCVATDQLTAYFEGERRTFDIPLVLGGTEFQRLVWRALADIPYGQTISYADLARRVDNPKAVRAVGSANGRNPIPIILPCHRVIGSGGELRGYAGGLDIKEKLLMHEGALPYKTELF
jgi:methylated-DNA-[protein]-cysteine S-methyltransferase